MLTIKQEKFVQSVVKGMSQREAYKNAYKTERMSDNAIDRESSLLMKNPKITQRYKELVEELEKETILTAQERLEYLTKVIKGEEKEKRIVLVKGESVEYEHSASIGTRIKAIDLMNKMTGEYVVKVDGDVNVKLEDLL